VAQFDAAIIEGRIAPGDPNSAFALLAKIRPALPADQYQARENRLITDMEKRFGAPFLTAMSDPRPMSEADLRYCAEAYGALKSLHPDVPNYSVARAVCTAWSFMLARRYSEGLSILMSVRTEQPNALVEDVLGEIYLSQGKYDSALIYFENAIRLDPRFIRPILNIAATRSAMGRQTEAEAEYKRALHQAPDSPAVVLGLADFYLKNHRPKDAANLLRVAINGSPDNATLFAFLGVALEQLGQKAESERSYRAALSKDPALLGTRYNLASLMYGRNRGEALQLCLENLRRDSAHVPSREFAAKILQEAGKYDEAIPHYQELIRLRPSNLTDRINLIRCLELTGHFDQALAEVDRAGPYVHETNIVLSELNADLLVTVGRAREARSSYQMALNNAVSADDKKRLRDKLARLANAK
jgi:tetratricopeptide (TPR) repeat protein